MSKARLASSLEHAVLLGVAQHKMYREIAESAGVTKEEVRACAAKLAARLGCSTKMDLIGKAQSLGYGAQYAEPESLPRQPPVFSGLCHGQSAVLEVCAKHADGAGNVSLSYLEITEAAGLHSPSTAGHAIRRLTRRGVLQRKLYHPRSIRVVWSRLNPLLSARVPA